MIRRATPRRVTTSQADLGLTRRCFVMRHLPTLLAFLLLGTHAAQGDDEKDLGKVQPPGGALLGLVRPGTTAIGVDELNKVRERLEAVPEKDLEKWVVELERIIDVKLKDGVPSPKQVCRTDFAIRMSVAFDGFKWNAKAADKLYKRGPAKRQALLRLQAQPLPRPPLEGLPGQVRPRPAGRQW